MTREELLSKVDPGYLERVRDIAKGVEEVRDFLVKAGVWEGPAETYVSEDGTGRLGDVPSGTSFPEG